MDLTVHSITLSQLTSFFESSDDGLWVLSGTRALLLNHKFYKPFGVPCSNVFTRDWIRRVHPNDVERVMQSIRERKAEPMVGRSLRYRVKNCYGEYRWIESLGMAIHEAHQQYILGYHKDVTEQVMLGFQHDFSSSTDPETGLYNQLTFLKDQVSGQGGLFVFTLTDLKGLQRRWGAGSLNLVISALVSAIGNVLSGEHFIYRFSYDVVIVKALSFESLNAEHIVSQVKTKFLKQCSIHQFDEVPKLMAMSLPDASLLGCDPASLIWKLSDYAQMVRDGLNYSGEHKVTIDRYYALKDGLLSGQICQQITIVLQPIKEFPSNALRGFEVLARWRHPDFGLVSPGDFISLAEQLGVISTIGLIVFKQACAFLVKFDMNSDLNPTISVNVSVQQLKDTRLGAQLLDIVESCGLQPQRVIIEITESYLVDDDPRIMETISDLSRCGFGLSLDDFGSGLSAITSLFRLPLTQLKLDKSFVEEALQSSSCLGLVSHLADYGTSFGVELVAEGIESLDMLGPLGDIGVRLFQGHAIEKPSEPSLLLAEVESRSDTLI